MRNFQIIFAVLVAASAFAAPTVLVAKQLTVQVVDNKGHPLPDAVVSMAAAPAPADIAIMDQLDKLFHPFVLAVTAGTRVQFPNSDNLRHQVYSFSKTKPFELPLYSNQQAPELLFDKPGIVVLGCNIHDHMRAYIYVSPHGQSVTTNSAGAALLEHDETGPVTVYAWYPGLGDQITDEQEFTVEADAGNLTIALPVTPDSQSPPPPSPLQQRFNRLKNNG
ncbi:methylamine utilization protein [Pseudidiomarina salinarum]|uniref:methylamine utilization protein n=1 Tax=Pseudidiomarina salinarum TaxID=435908 RepID=UPI000691B585|nr:methylamine utilization protein [Pseudidiomarina salinarum]RUO70670.1 methylamine utilization protein [Pseudidiomarina salinarum]